MRGAFAVQESGHTTVSAFVYLASAPYQRLERVSWPGGAGDMLNGFDGEVAWSFDPRTNSAQTYDGDDRESAKRDADYYYPLDELSWFKSMDTVAEEDFEGRPCFRLHVINNWNKSNPISTTATPVRSRATNLLPIWAPRTRFFPIISRSTAFCSR